MSKTVKAPGASIYYEVRGAGPVLLLIPGGPADAGVFTGMASILADRYRVVAVDPRGNSRSSVDGEPAEWRVEQQADDARRVIEAVGDAPALVFGNSSGALVALELALRFPDRVRAVIAHEPPATELLPDRERYRTEYKQIQEACRREGVGAAMAKFMVMAGLSAPTRADARPTAPPDPTAMESMARMGRNFERFLADGLGRVGAHVPDMAALRESSCPVVIAAGEASHRQPAYRASEALATELGTTLRLFPGDHGGFVSDAPAFARKLDEVLGECTLRNA